MSHSVASINAIDPAADVITLPSAGVVFSWNKKTTGSLNVGSITHGLTKNTPFYQRSLYINMVLGTGVSVARSANFPLSSGAVNWFDEITLPEGEYTLHHSFCGSGSNIQTGAVAWVNNVTDARLSQLMSFRDDHRACQVDFSFSAPPSGLKIAARILEASVAIHSLSGVSSTSIIIVKA